MLRLCAQSNQANFSVSLLAIHTPTHPAPTDLPAPAEAAVALVLLPELDAPAPAAGASSIASLPPAAAEWRVRGVQEHQAEWVRQEKTPWEQAAVRLTELRDCGCLPGVCPVVRFGTKGIGFDETYGKREMGSKNRIDTMGVFEVRFPSRLCTESRVPRAGYGEPRIRLSLGYTLIRDGRVKAYQPC